MPKETPGDTAIPHSQWLEFLQEVWDGRIDHHYSQDEMVNYVDRMLSAGDEAAEKAFPKIAAHCKECARCSGDVASLIDIVEEVGGG